MFGIIEEAQAYIDGEAANVTVERAEAIRIMQGLLTLLQINLPLPRGNRRLARGHSYL